MAPSGAAAAGNVTISALAGGKAEYAAVTSSSDGTKLAAVSGVDSQGNLGSIYMSTDSGFSWTKQTSPGVANWTAITSSGDGTHLAAVSIYKDTSYAPGSVWTSADSGVTWTEQTAAGSAGWISITSSADGTKLAAVSEANTDYSLPGSIYTSDDSGATWTEDATTAGLFYWAGIASSANGSKLAAVADSDAAYDFGSLWTYVGLTTAPIFSASTPSIANTYVGSFSAVQTETITNTGDGDLVFGAGAVTKTGANAADYTIVADNCSSQTVAPAGTCTVTYKFKSAVAGTRTANLVFASNAVSSPDTVGLSAVAMGVVSIKKIESTSGSTRGGQSVEIYGTGFTAGSTVTFGGVNATVTKRSGSTKIVVRTPAHASGKVLVIVTNPDTGSASYNGYTYKK